MSSMNACTDSRTSTNFERRKKMDKWREYISIDGQSPNYVLSLITINSMDPMDAYAALERISPKQSKRKKEEEFHWWSD